MILAPLVGIILNLRNATSTPNHVMAYDVATVLAGLDVSAAVIAKFQYLIDYSWVRINILSALIPVLNSSICWCRPDVETQSCVRTESMQFEGCLLSGQLFIFKIAYCRRWHSKEIFLSAEFQIWNSLFQNWSLNQKLQGNRPLLMICLQWVQPQVSDLFNLPNLPSCLALQHLVEFIAMSSKSLQCLHMSGELGIGADLLGSLAMMDREEACTICYACEVDTIFLPCKHKSCQRCISRHLLNSQQCFFCNSTIIKLSFMLPTPAIEDGECPADPNKGLAESLTNEKTST